MAGFHRIIFNQQGDRFMIGILSEVKIDDAGELKPKYTKTLISAERCEELYSSLVKFLEGKEKRAEDKKKTEEEFMKVLDDMKEMKEQDDMFKKIFGNSIFN